MLFIPLFDYIYLPCEMFAVMTTSTFGNMHPIGESSFFKTGIMLLRDICGLHASSPIIAPRTKNSGEAKLVKIPISGESKDECFKKFPDVKNEDSLFNGVLFTQEKVDAVVARMPSHEFAFFSTTFDCPILVLFSHVKKETFFIGFIHVSLQTILDGVIENTVAIMKKAGCNPRYIEACTLPGIDACCYGISLGERDAILKHARGRWLFTKSFDGFTRAQIGKKKNQIAVFLKNGIAGALLKAGVPNPGLKHYVCTSCSEHKFFSSTKGDERRNGVLVVVKPY